MKSTSSCYFYSNKYILSARMTQKIMLSKLIFPNGIDGFQAVARGDCDELNRLIDSGKASPNEGFLFNCSQIVSLMANGLNYEVVKSKIKFLKEGLIEGDITKVMLDMMDLYCKHDTKNPSSILMLACILGHAEIVKLLIMKGANLQYKTKENMTALHYAIVTPYTDMKIVYMLMNPPNHVNGIELKNSLKMIALSLLPQHEYIQLVIWNCESNTPRISKKWCQ